LVASGDTKREVEDICGPPSFVDIRQEENALKIFRKSSYDSNGSDQKTKKEDKKKHDTEDGYESLMSNHL